MRGVRCAELHALHRAPGQGTLLLGVPAVGVAAVVSARAIWKGHLVLGKHEVPVRMFSGVEDRKVHFHLLHAKDRAPVEQRIVRKDTDEVVAKEDVRKAYPMDDGTAVILEAEELQSIEPPESRAIDLCRFVAPSALSDQWFDRPYYLGPDEDEKAYFALAKALGKRQLVGIARWTMRKKRYLGALVLLGDYLSIITLRRSEQVLSLPALQPDKARAPSEAELQLAGQLLSSIAGDFEPQRWHDEYSERLRELIATKERGEKVKAIKPRKPKPGRNLAETLRASLAAAREQRVG